MTRILGALDELIASGGHLDIGGTPPTATARDHHLHFVAQVAAPTLSGALSDLETHVARWAAAEAVRDVPSLDLREVLSTGGLGVAPARAAISASWGVPEDWGMGEDVETAAIWVYGGLELCFDGSRLDGVLCDVWNIPGDTLPTREECRGFRPTWGPLGAPAPLLEDVEAWLIAAGVSSATLDPECDAMPDTHPSLAIVAENRPARMVVLPSGVGMAFELDEEGRWRLWWLGIDI